MSLKERLKAQAKQNSGKMPEGVLPVMMKAIGDQVASGAAVKRLGVGATLPPFELQNQSGDTVRSADLLAQGPLVITVYRGVW